METQHNNGKKVSESSVFSGFLKKAEGYLTKPGRVTTLLNDAYQKASSQKEVSEIASDVWDSLQDLFRLIKSAVSGEYTGIPTKTVIGGVAVLIYFISPIDVIPDFIPIVGLLDDMSLMAWFMTSIAGELDKFRAWEKEGGRNTSSQQQLSSSLGAQQGKTGRDGQSAVKDHGDQGGRALPGTDNTQTTENHARSSSASAGNAGTGSSYQSQSTKTNSSGEPGAKTGKAVNSPEEATRIANSHGTSRDSEYLAAGRSDGKQKSPTAADYPGSAGEMRKDVTGEAKDETHKVGGSAAGGGNKTSGNLHSDESQGNGKNLGDSSRTPKSDSNPNKDGAHNR